MGIRKLDVEKTAVTVKDAKGTDGGLQQEVMEYGLQGQNLVK